MSRYRFALRPAWIVSHLFVLLLIVTMINLGFWQLRRLDQRKEFNATVREHAAAEPVTGSQLVRASDGANDVAAVEWRRVTVRGAYRRDDVLVANRALDGEPGYWIVTPLVTVDSGTVAVVRGFVTRALVTTGPVPGTAASSEPVEVTGFVRVPGTSARFATDTANGELTQTNKVDVRALGQRWGVTLAPYWVQLSEQQPPQQGDALRPVPRPKLDNGPHLSYAIQWFIFSAIGIVGYPLILRRNAHGRSREAAKPDGASEAVR